MLFWENLDSTDTVVTYVTIPRKCHDHEAQPCRVNKRRALTILLLPNPYNNRSTLKQSVGKLPMGLNQFTLAKPQQQQNYLETVSRKTTGGFNQCTLVIPLQQQNYLETVSRKTTDRLKPVYSRKTPTTAELP